MEYITNNERTFLEDLLALRDTSDHDNYAFPNSDYNNYFNPNFIWPTATAAAAAAVVATTSAAVDSSYNNTSLAFPIPTADPYTPFDDDYSALLPYTGGGGAPFADDLSPPDFGSLDLPNYQDQEYSYYGTPSARDDGEGGDPFVNGAPNVGPAGAPCKVESLPEMPAASAAAAGSYDVGISPPPDLRKCKVKKVSGQPSKNLMAERRRRKRLNDRLSMLRSVVPKISKMDRTSILGDTIDYMKELLERINSLQEDMQLGSDQMGIMSIFKDVKPNEVLVRNSPKFEVERRNEDTRVEICCGGKPGLLLSTVTTLEALGLDFKHCIISCFNDFALQASCSEELKKRAMMNTEDIKQALVRNAGYGGKCV
ncbi:transcription factor bHLH93-like [Andrographis paniculata]|uniref:transcription factor bHLH93-like n=1 Tax=Andrographis paniculata TaxID=175694 RepID=UPI0021E78934|nr:transcription factor bHLH93-like [Andrographis paniculata]